MLLGDDGFNVLWVMVGGDGWGVWQRGASGDTSAGKGVQWRRVDGGIGNWAEVLKGERWRELTKWRGVLVHNCFLDVCML